MPVIKIALADDEQLFLDGLRHILEQDKNISVLFTANDGSALVEKLAAADVLPDIVLLDLRMKPLDGIATTQQLREKYPELKVMILSSHYHNTFLGYMLKLGVAAFLPKNINPGTLVKAIGLVNSKGLYLTDDHVAGIRQQLASGKTLQAPHTHPSTELTRREKEILQLICDECSSAEIAEKLFLSIRTVEGHRNNLLQKTGARNTAGLVLYALLHNLVDVNKKLLDFTIAS